MTAHSLAVKNIKQQMHSEPSVVRGHCPGCTLLCVTSVDDEEVEGSRHSSFDPQVSVLPTRPGDIGQFSFC